MLNLMMNSPTGSKRPRGPSHPKLGTSNMPNKPNQPSLDELRISISEVDQQLMELIQKRMHLCEQVGEYKKIRNLPIKDYGIEKKIIERVRREARDSGLDEGLFESIFKTLIEHSVMIQDELHKRASDLPTDHKTVLIIGGHGLMGRWLAQLFESFGHKVQIFDPKVEESSPYPVVKNLEDGCVHADFMILATPISTTAETIEAIIPFNPKGVLVEICSLKSTVIPALEKARQSGIQFCSIHPMFGPTATTLAGRNMIICQSEGHAYQEIEEILKKTYASLIHIPLKDHDRLMGYVLGSAHLLNLLFAKVMSTSEFSLPSLLSVAGTTFLKQLDVTKEVVSENQDLYFEIQALNNESPALLEGFRSSLDGFEKAIIHKDRDHFKTQMASTDDFFREKNEQT